MAQFIVRPVTREITTEVRTTRRAPRYGHPVYQEVARATGPCRECLRAFEIGREDRLLFTYSPFGSGPELPQPGPVFVHAEVCDPHTGPGYPDGLRTIPIAAQLYHNDGTIADPVRLPAGEEESVLAILIHESGVQFAHLRHAESGCFVARVDRAM